MSPDAFDYNPNPLPPLGAAILILVILSPFLFLAYIYVRGVIRHHRREAERPMRGFDVIEINKER